MADLWTVLLRIVQFSHVHPFLPGCDAAHGYVRVNPLAKGDHATTHLLEHEVDGHVGVVHCHH